MSDFVDSVSPEQLTKWLALAEMDGWGDEERRTAALLAEIHNSALILASKTGGSVKGSELKDVFDFLPKWPWGEKRPKVEATKQTPEEMEALGKRMAGF